MYTKTTCDVFAWDFLPSAHTLIHLKCTKQPCFHMRRVLFLMSYVAIVFLSILLNKM